MNEYRVTFGQRFRYDQHKKFTDAHPDGWITVMAWDYAQAHVIAMAALGDEWSGLYEASDDDIDWPVMFPRGELARLDGTGEPLLIEGAS